MTQVNVVDSDGGIDLDEDNDESPSESGSGGNAGTSAGIGGSAGVSGMSVAGAGSAPLDVCRRGGTCTQVAIQNVDKVDLLFMVDNSGSMREEQVSLRRELPHLIRVLTTGDRDGDGTQDFAPAKDLHLGVVSSDMGLTGINGIEACDALGDNGRMNNVPTTDPAVVGCQPSYPARFLEYNADLHDPSQAATDFACLATLGTDGCGFEQQLESTLKALWPSDDTRVSFLPDTTGFGQFGQGDPMGENAGFLRSDPTRGLSAIAIVVVTDEEDCSSKTTRHFTPDIYLMDGDPLKEQGLNTRCYHNKDNLHSIAERYYDGFRALRPGNEHLVSFSAIVGVPTELVSPSRIAEADFDNAMTREAFYDELLAHPAMQEVIDDRGTPESPSDDSLVPSCGGASDDATSKAYPPRRIVELARMFGENGMVQSICQEDFGPAMDLITSTISRQLGTACLSEPLERDDDGLAFCDVYWSLPPPSAAPAGTPTDCAGASFLSTPRGGAIENSRGGQVCRVAQLAVRNEQPQPTSDANEGFYYDDFSEEAEMECQGELKARIAFTPSAKPPTGVEVILDCD